MSQNKKGFTLLEILLVVAAITILSSIIVFSINPADNLGDTYNAERSAETSGILNSVWAFAIDNGGRNPETINAGDVCHLPENEICITGGDCEGYTDLSMLEGAYLAIIPTDPSGADGNGTGYYIVENEVTERVTVCAPNAYQGEISLTR